MGGSFEKLVFMASMSAIEEYGYMVRVTCRSIDAS